MSYGAHDDEEEEEEEEKEHDSGEDMNISDDDQEGRSATSIDIAQVCQGVVLLL